MKVLLKTALITMAITTCGVSVAGVGEFENEETTCFVFKNNELVKKAVCTYEGSSGAAASGYAVFEATFNVEGYGAIDIVDNWFAEDDGRGGWKNEQSTTTLDGKTAMQHNRHAKNYKILANNSSSADSLTCYASKTQELCYVDNTPR